ncbi:MAG: non-canonical purine NTP diphosphatase [Bacteroidaceae bacterium]|nr:non-canonical purine NTP diphosphatase [Bacteroidaceae bacterium]
MKAKLKNQKPILVFATNNAHKLEEVRTIIGNKFEIRSLEDINCKVELPETSDTLEGNALQKAQYVKKFYGFDCFADDTGLECEALNGEPGVMTARYAGGAGHDDKANIQKLLTNLQDKENRKAQFRTSIALIYKGQTYSFEGIVKGTIAEEKRGEAGFGYDPVFIPEGYTDTFAQLGGDIKNTISHRAKAVSQLCDFLVHSEQEKRRRLVNHKSK